MNQAQQINQTSGEVEYYTDPEIISAARSFLGVIELDPASSAKANETIKAVRFFGIGDDSLNRKWNGRIWMNHPFGRKEPSCAEACDKAHVHHDYPFHGNAAWIDKLVTEYDLGNITEALCITYACTSEKWFQPLFAFPQCFLAPRTNYYLPDGTLKKGVTKGSVITYIGDHPIRFKVCFHEFGTCHQPL
jgi:hypothetical protein